MPTADLAARAASRHVVVVGAGIAGLVAARECAKVGMRVTVLEAADQVGGTIRRAQLDGLTIDTGADSFATRGGHVRTLVDELGLGDAIVPAGRGRTWIAGIPGVGSAPLPEASLRGIPESPFDDDVRRIIGWRGAWRAYLDRLRPPLTIGHAESLGRLVASRMGARVRDRLMAPPSIGGFAIHPDDASVDATVPGLNAALTRAGSLSGAVAQLRAEKQGSDAALCGISGGLHRLVDALRAELEMLGATLHTRTTVTTLVRGEAGWTIECVESDPGAGDAGPDAAAVAGTIDAAPGASALGVAASDAGVREEGSDATAAVRSVAAVPGAPAPGTPDSVPGAATSTAGVADRRREPLFAGAAPSAPGAADPRWGPFFADAVIVAAPESVARMLLADLSPVRGSAGDAAPDTAREAARESVSDAARTAASDAGPATNDHTTATPIEVVTLLVDTALDDAPAEVYPIAGTHTACALQRTTTKWAWLADAAAGREILRVTFGEPGRPPATADMTDADAAALATEQAASLLGVPKESLPVVASHRERHTQTQPASAIGAAASRARSRTAIAQVPGLAIVGAWLAGTGLAQVIPDAIAETDRLRRALLWGNAGSDVK